MPTFEKILEIILDPTKPALIDPLLLFTHMDPIGKGPSNLIVATSSPMFSFETIYEAFPSILFQTPPQVPLEPSWQVYDKGALIIRIGFWGFLTIIIV